MQESLWKNEKNFCNHKDIREILIKAKIFSARILGIRAKTILLMIQTCLDLNTSDNYRYSSFGQMPVSTGLYTE